MNHHEPILSNLEKLSQHKRILLLQGSIGSFFKDLSIWLEKKYTATVFKINFNQGDAFFYPPNEYVFNYLGHLSNFSDYLSDFIQKNQIDAVVCFGDNRPYHRLAKNLLKNQTNIPFFVFEEGYFRPFWITLEEQGVNANSPLPREADFFRQAFSQLKEQHHVQDVNVRGGFLPVAKVAMQYYGAMYLGRHNFPNYHHHRSKDIWHYIGLWAESGLKRAYYFLTERAFARKIERGDFGRFFILPLQVFNDSQIRFHSHFASVRDFLLEVMISFAQHAPSETRLLIKHHPMDRGFIDYQKDIDDLMVQFPQLIGRVYYVHDVPLPVFLRHGVGMVTMNSTSGLSALLHNMPVKVLGRAHYDIPELTDQQPLADFWRNPMKPDDILFHQYRLYHLNITQINGSFYSEVRLPK